MNNIIRIKNNDSFKSLIKDYDFHNILIDMDDSEESESELKDFLLSLKYIDLNHELFLMMIDNENINLELLSIDDLLENQLDHIEYFFNIH